MKIAVIGAGVFGATVALKLESAGYKVDLFEREGDILQAASGINQYRLHRGYHYPRSGETVSSLLNAEQSFISEYGEAVHTKNQYYAIAKAGSKTSGKQFKEFCEKWGLEHNELTLPWVNPQSVDSIIKARESLIDPNKLRAIIKNRLKKSKIRLFLNHAVTKKELRGYDFIINCTYSNLNQILENEPGAQFNYQFELCEKPVLKLPKTFAGKGLVVLDGPFTCIDPYSDTDLHVMGHVVHAIHATNIGLFPVIPERFKKLLNKGIIKNPPITNISKFLESASYFMPEIKKAKHIGSMYTIRTVLPNVDHTDERPTIVRKVNDKIINVFSGKIPTCVIAADAVVTLVKAAAVKPLTRTRR